MSIIDDNGMAVAFTDTIEQWFGSGIVVPNFGFLLNNELTDFNAEKDMVNSPAAGKRPRSNMSPLILLAHGKPVAVIGCAGGGRIPTTLVEILEDYYIHQMGLREAVAFPRFSSQCRWQARARARGCRPARAQAERGWLRRVSENIHTTPHGIIRRTLADPWETAAEPRGDGFAFTSEPKRK